jgi:predicted RND superfamily exporter protein
VAGGAVCLAVLAVLGARRVTFDTDVLSLLPRTGQVIPAFRTFVEHFGSLDELYVVFSAPEGHAVSDYRDEIESWIDRLRGSGYLTRLDTGLGDPSRNLEWLAAHQLLLLRGSTLEAALERFRGDGMREAIAARRELLAVPSPAVAAMVRQDPLGLFDLLGTQLGDGAAFGVRPGEEGYVTADSRSRLIIAYPARPPYDTQFSRALEAALQRVRDGAAQPATPAPEQAPLPPLQVEFAGGHRIAVETESVVRRESIMNSVVSLALILPLLFLVFRSAWLIAVGPLPSALALVVVLGVLGLAGSTLSAAATASAAMLFGLGVDGVVLLYVVHSLALHDRSRATSGVDHLAGPASSMLLGMWTTAATFYGLTFVDFPSLQQLGALIGHAMVLCGVLTLVLVPALLPRAARGARKPVTMPSLAAWIGRHRRGILAAAAVATIALGAAAVNVRINPTLDRLRSVTPGAGALERIRAQFGLPQEVYVVMQRGADLEALLRENEAMRERAAATLPSVTFQAASALLPSAGAQAQRAERIRGLGLSPEVVARDLEAAGAAEGFRPASFAPFQQRLARLLDPQARITFADYATHGLSDLVGRFVKKTGSEWLVASYAFPRDAAEVAAVQQLIGEGSTLTGLPLVNQELASRFLPQFAKGLVIGSIIVLMLIVATFRDWRSSLLALTPAVVGLIWAAGLLALARVELDLFAVFAVVTFVGIGVDYGVHLVHRCRERGAAHRATEELAPVILVAAAITLMGYGTLVTSTYPPLRSIGLVSIVAVFTLSIASVLMLPAILAGPGVPQEAAVRQSS